MTNSKSFKFYPKLPTPKSFYKCIMYPPKFPPPTHTYLYSGDLKIISQLKTHDTTYCNSNLNNKEGKARLRKLLLFSHLNHRHY